MHPDGGFAWLDAVGTPDLTRDVELWICTRMTHVAALGVMEGDQSSNAMLEHGMEAFSGRLRDAEYGGWFAAVGRDGPVNTDKRAYEHAFVILAAASATAAGHAGGAALVDEALAVFDEHFWDEGAGLVVDVWDRRWGALEAYRGVNANMHSVEALLSAADITGSRLWRDRAYRIVERVVHDFAAGNRYRLPEHYSADWQELRTYNRQEPNHPFRPYGVTIGHLMEWARLALHTRTALGDAAPGWLLADARALFDAAISDGWTVDGAEGFVYTTDYDGTPIVRERLHWVVTEAIAAAWALFTTTGEPSYAAWYRTWWDHARRLFIDGTSSWRHELDSSNRPSSTVWAGRPDVYHAYQAALLPVLRPMVSFAGGMRDLRESHG
jgi:mannose/cellobiose epimerase-like protein (N-acyl-D-glucosamine 2-epimerase family)